MHKLAICVAVVSWALGASAQSPPGDRYGTRKPPCGCYVCGKLLAVTFPNASDCAGILAADACGEHLGNLPGNERQAYCDKIKSTMKFTSFESSCREFAGYCSGDTTAKDPPPAQPPGTSSAAPGAAPAPAPTPTPPASSPPAAVPSTPREAFISPNQPPPSEPDREWFTAPRESPASPAGSASGASSGGAQGVPPSVPTQAPNMLRLIGLRLDPPHIVGGHWASGFAELSEAPGPDGFAVTLASSHPEVAAVPPLVVVTHGAASADTGPIVGARFPIDTRPVAEDRSVTVRASARGQTIEARLSVRHARLIGAGLEGGDRCAADATLHYNLDGAAPPGGYKVEAGAAIAAGLIGMGHPYVDTVRAGESSGSMRIHIPACPRNVCQILVEVAGRDASKVIHGTCYSASQ